MQGYFKEKTRDYNKEIKQDRKPRQKLSGDIDLSLNSLLHAPLRPTFISLCLEQRMAAPVDINFLSLQKRLTRVSGCYFKFPRKENLNGPFGVRYPPLVQSVMAIDLVVHCFSSRYGSRISKKQCEVFSMMNISRRRHGMGRHHKSCLLH